MKGMMCQLVGNEQAQAHARVEAQEEVQGEEEDEEDEGTEEDEDDDDNDDEEEEGILRKLFVVEKRKAESALAIVTP